MLKIYDDAKDKNIANYVCYVTSGDHNLYVDKECTIQVKQEEAEEAFLKGRLVIMNDDFEAGDIKIIGNPTAMLNEKVFMVTVSNTTCSGTVYLTVPTPEG